LASSDRSRLSVSLIEVEPGREADFQEIAASFEDLLIRKNYGRADTIRDESSPLRFFAVRHWNDAAAARQCHADSDVRALTERLRGFARITHLINGVRPPDSPPERKGREYSDVDRRAGLDRRAGDAGNPTGRERRAGDRRVGVRRAARSRGARSDLLSAARRAREFAHATFSKFKVGAALETADGNVITGCNVENATYGLTICAERVAMFKALSDGHRAFVRIAVVADTDEPTPPCGACRQILWEFGGDLEVHLANLRDRTATYRLRELLPLPFDRRLL
jgi:cytidine deaminase